MAVRARTELAELLAQTPAVSDLTDILADDVVSALIRHTVLLAEEDAEALSGGLVAPSATTIGQPLAYQDLDALPTGSFCLFGVPLDTARVPPLSPFHGPACIRKALAAYSPKWSSAMPFDLGDVLNWPTDGLNAIGGRVQWLTRRISESGAIQIMLGGDHSVSYFAISGLASQHQQLAVVQLDAHADLAPPSGARWRAPLNHASVMSYVLELPHVLQITQIGLRREIEDAQTRIRAYSVQALRRESIAAVIDAIPDVPVYLTIDLDVLDPQLAPEVTTPLPSGLLMSEVKDLLVKLLTCRRVIAFDLVEVCAGFGEKNLAAACAAELVDVLHGVISGDQH